MAKRKPPKGSDIPEWVVTYGDLMSLLLCFFILLAAFSELKDPDEYRKVIIAIQEALGYQGGMGFNEIADTTNNSMINDLAAMKKAGLAWNVSEEELFKLLKRVEMAKKQAYDKAEYEAKQKKSQEVAKKRAVY